MAAKRKHPAYWYSRESMKTGKTDGFMVKGPTRSAQARRLAEQMGKDLRAGKIVYVGRGKQRVSIFQDSEDPTWIRSKYLRRRRTVDPREYGRKAKSYNLKPRKNPEYIAGQGMPDFNPNVFGESNLKW